MGTIALYADYTDVSMKGRGNGIRQREQTCASFERENFLGERVGMWALAVNRPMMRTFQNVRASAPNIREGVAGADADEVLYIALVRPHSRPLSVSIAVSWFRSREPDKLRPVHFTHGDQ